VLTWVGLEDRLDAYPSELSGGEQQRVAIARAVITDPMMILADEPTGNLDPDLALEVMNLFREINATGTTVVVATHDRELIRQVGQRSIMLEHGVITEETPAVAADAFYASAGYAPPVQVGFEEVDATLVSEGTASVEDEGVAVDGLGGKEPG